MAERTIHPLVKSVLEFGPVLAFFAAYLMLKDEIFTIRGTEYEGFILVTAGFVPLMVLSTGILWKLTGKLSKMQALTLILIVVFGGLSVWLNDERFFKMKPTMIYLLFGFILGFGLWRGESYLWLNYKCWVRCLCYRITDSIATCCIYNDVLTKFRKRWCE